MNRLLPQSAMVLALQAAALALLLDRPANLGLLAAAAAAYWLWGGGWRHWRLALLVLGLGTWSLTLSQGMFFEALPRTVAATLLPAEVFPFGSPPGLYLYREGLIHGLVQSLRFDTALLMGAGLLARYATDEIVAGLRALRMPGPLAFLFSLALRFVPLMAAEARAVWTAQRLRGLRIFRGAPWHWPLTAAGALRALLLPLLAAKVRRSDEIAAALLSRGLSPHDAPPVVATPARERMLWALGTGALLLLLSGQVLTRLHRAGVYSRPGLDWVYDLMLRHV